VNDPVLSIALVVAAYLAVASSVVVWRYVREVAGMRPAAEKPRVPEKPRAARKPAAAEATREKPAAEVENDRRRVGSFLRLVALYVAGFVLVCALAALAQPLIGPLVPSVMPDDRRRAVLALALGWSLVAINVFVAWHLVGALLPQESAKGGPGEMGGRIGMLERGLVVMLTLSGGPGSIGFVIAAKTLARFKELDDQDFAERYLLGTLASVTIALASALAAQQVWINAA
jgi:hypothetical protein